MKLGLLHRQGQGRQDASQLFHETTLLKLNGLRSRDISPSPSPRLKVRQHPHISQSTLTVIVQSVICRWHISKWKTGIRAHHSLFSHSKWSVPRPSHKLLAFRKSTTSLNNCVWWRHSTGYSLRRLGEREDFAMSSVPRALSGPGAPSFTISPYISTARVQVRN